MGRSSDARDRLLHAAGKLFHERGFNDVSVADICAAAGVQKGSFYHFFKTKKDLMLAALDGFGAWFEEAVANRIDAEAPALEQLEQLMMGMAAAHRADFESAGCLRGCPVGNMAIEMAHRCPAIQAKVQEIFAGWKRWIERLIQVGMTRGELAVDDPSAVAEALVANLEGAVLLAKAKNDPSVFPRVMRSVLSMLKTTEARTLEPA